jgi:iron complex outermembrane recepter protein
MFVLPRNFAVATPANDAITSMDNYYRLKIKHDFNDNWHLNIQAASSNGPWDGEQLYSQDHVPITNDTLYRSFALQHWINYTHPAQAFIDGKFKTGPRIEHKVLFGLDYHNEGSKGEAGWTDKQFGLYIPNPDYYIHPDSLKIAITSPRHGKIRWVALYIQDHVKIARKLVITLAGHFTHASNTWEGFDWIPEDEKKIINNAFTPRAGLTWLFGNNVSVYALYDQSFVPQVGRSFDHERFEPVTGSNIETGLKAYLFNKKLSLNLSIFDIVKNHVVTADPDHPGFRIQTGQIVSKGIDFDVTGNVTPSLIVNANYEYIDAKVTKETDPNSIGIKNFLTPDYRANLWLQYKLLKGKLKNLSFSAGYQYTGKRGAVWYFWNPDRTKVLPAYSLFDAAIGYRNEKFNIGFNIYNITNINYAAIGYFNPTGGWKYTPGEPVNFRLSFGVNLIRHKKKLK